MDAYQLIETIFKDKSFRAKMAKMLGVGEIPENVVGWTSHFWQQGLGRKKLEEMVNEKLPDVELYIDVMAKNATYYMEKMFSYFMSFVITYTTIHELVHILANSMDEDYVDGLTSWLLKPELKKMVKILNPDSWMGWKWILCPKTGENVDWNECLSCRDVDKHESCPIRNIRIDAFPRQYELGKYHVTELAYPRNAYFNRLYGFTRSWDEYYDLLYGKALGWYIESRYAPHENEVDLEIKDTKNGETIKVVGHGDLMHLTWGIELKFYYSTRYVQQAGAPNENHTYQVQAYWSMGKRCKPWMFNDIEALKVIYYSKMKGKSFPRRKEFDVALVDRYDELIESAWALHNALKTGVPPPKTCPSWLCRYCKARKECNKLA